VKNLQHIPYIEHKYQTQMLSKYLSPQYYLDFHTHRMRRADREDIVEIISQHLGKEVEAELYTIGKHPWWTDHPITIEEKETLKIQLEKENCLAMGEMGLDKFKGPPMQEQMQILRSQLDLAVELKLPVIIHCVRTIHQLLEIKKEYPQLKKICLHGYARHANLAQQLIKEGFYLSIMPVKRVDQKYKELILSLPLDKFFLETDSMAEIQIEDVYLQVAKILGLSLDRLKAQLYQNALNFFENE
jgi:TatD DNase family protein